MANRTKSAVAARWTQSTARQIEKRLLEALQSQSANVEDNTAEGALARGRLFSVALYHEKAIESFREALSLDPSQYEAAARLVLVLLRTRRHEEALEVATKLAAEAPDYELPEMTSDERISVFTLLGNALVQNQRTDDAIQAYQTARKLSKRDTTAAARLAQLYLSSGEPKRALEQSSAFSRNPRFQDLASVLTLGKTNEALLPTYRRASIADIVGLTDHGRPLTVPDGSRLASVVEGSTAWCAEPRDVLADDASE
ncbi:tetratricopeptide repeat protein [Myxococcus stipitatus]|uniref:tetratricopeptide repeat protein n=1 Tax=Myxococcus stipitatus TaxID=83455 RepID=UPI001F16CA28|nr:tetratricopeptide repeat protein [Myxococcus stipitatus]MCE9667072.1 tetratricopeptide repeat protein [Myxococcus stipitatus]